MPIVDSVITYNFPHKGDKFPLVVRNGLRVLVME